MFKTDLAIGRGLSNLGKYQEARDEIRKGVYRSESLLDLADTFDCYMIGTLSAICTDEQWDAALQSATRMMNEHITQKEVSTLPEDKTTLDETEPKTEESDDEDEDKKEDEESE